MISLTEGVKPHGQREEMIEAQVKCFRGSMNCHTLGSEAKKKKKKRQQKQAGSSGEGEQRRTKVKSQLVLLLIKFPAYIKSSLGSYGDILVNVQIN